MRALALFAATLGTLVACSAPDPSSTPGTPGRQSRASAPSDDTVVAEVNGSYLLKRERAGARADEP